MAIKTDIYIDQCKAGAKWPNRKNGRKAKAWDFAHPDFEMTRAESRALRRKFNFYFSTPNRKITIPFGLPTKIAGNKKKIVALSWLFLLKSLYNDSDIHNYKSRYYMLSRFFKCSENTMRSRIKDLLRMGLAKDVDGRLCLIGLKKLKKKLKVKTKSFKKVYKLKFLPPKEMADEIIALAVNELRKQVDFNKKNQSRDRRQVVPLSTRRFINAYRKISNSASTQEDISLLEMPWYQTDNLFTLSRNKIAQIGGRKTKASGTNYMKRMAKRGRVQQDDVNFKKLPVDMDYETFYMCNPPQNYVLLYNKLFFRRANTVLVGGET